MRELTYTPICTYAYACTEACIEDLYNSEYRGIHLQYTTYKHTYTNACKQKYTNTYTIINPNTERTMQIQNALRAHYLNYCALIWQENVL